MCGMGIEHRTQGIYIYIHTHFNPPILLTLGEGQEQMDFPVHVDGPLHLQPAVHKTSAQVPVGLSGLSHASS